MPTYIAPQYKDDRNKVPRINSYYQKGSKPPKIHSARGQSTGMNDTYSTEDYTKRKVRRGHFKIDDLEITVQEVDMDSDDYDLKNKGSCKPNISESLQKDLGYWCPHCYNLFLSDNEAGSHLED